MAVVGVLPPIPPARLGDPGFRQAHGLDLNYVVGEMAGGISTTRMVIAAARAGMLSYFGAGGLAPATVEEAVRELSRELPDRAWGVNLIHSPNEPGLEEAIASIVLRYGVQRISASAYMKLTPELVWCAASGLTMAPDGQVVRKTRVMAKVSRPEVARAFLSPAPADLLQLLIEKGRLTPDEAALASRIPVADDLTVEADSGGHTDNRPLTVAFPRIVALRDQLVQRNDFRALVRVGAAGGLGTPQAIAAAFALGADYVLTGSVNQVAREAGISNRAKALLLAADVSDVTMAPCADMFELGVRVQVLKRGTMYAPRARRLFELYSSRSSLDDLTAKERTELEERVLHARLDDIWEETRQFWKSRDPRQLERAASDPKHRMALIFRWYLGQSSQWTKQEDAKRQSDFQLGCGPAMGGFNQWIAGTALADPARLTVTSIGRSLMTGAALMTRLNDARRLGFPVGAITQIVRPGMYGIPQE
ncbi:PfaD family polyunsaturated fatty acid/polyketide biosynthesis protein [Streptomyces formicae]|uniref:PfaD family polyunsaturated fatty acid/polyketide biosynthesis protein n=2 Tax=Streptomyces formicae TaxID=1616117 RepID=A0ABY3X411_9ACTN|nr:PfaD family polyunsaturated fatty acid/polyketide biosynthesis protein [Streptomyces formicae]